MIRTIISDIGNVLSGFTWYDFYKSKGYSEEMVERLAKATVGSDIWKEYDRGVLSEEEILNRFIANDPELKKTFAKRWQTSTASWSVMIMRFRGLKS